MKFVKKWYYLMLLIVVGLCYFGITKDWSLYAEPIYKVTEFCRSFQGQKEKPSADHIAEQIGDQITNRPTDAPVAGEEAEGKDAEEEITADNDSWGQDEVISEETLYQTVDVSYFEDAVFIGDSRTVGLYEYGELEEIADFYASTGMNIYRLSKEKIVQLPGQKKKVTVEEALREKQYGKIYFMLGINELGTGTAESFAQKYQETIQQFHELQPEAIIYVQAVMKVSTERSNQGDYITNEGIEERNLALKELTDEETYFYLDVNPVVCDEEGGLRPEYTFDGVHLKAQYVEIWKNFLMEHAVVKE